MSEVKVAPLRAEDVLSDVGYEKFVSSLFNRAKGDQSKDWAHAVLGIATEIRELVVAEDEVHGLEEQGDLRFYGQAVINLTEEFSGDEFDFDLCDAEYDALVARGEVIGSEDAIDEARTVMLDHAKRWVGYGKEPKHLLLAGAQALALAQFVMAHARFVTTDVDKVELANVAKLLDRYKGLKFDAERAVNRDVSSERAVLEAKA